MFTIYYVKVYIYINVHYILIKLNILSSLKSELKH